MSKGESKDKAIFFQADGDVIWPKRMEREAGGIWFPNEEWLLEDKELTILYELNRADGTPQAKGAARIWVDEPEPNHASEGVSDLLRQRFQKHLLDNVSKSFVDNLKSWETWLAIGLVCLASVMFWLTYQDNLKAKAEERAHRQKVELAGKQEDPERAQAQAEELLSGVNQDTEQTGDQEGSESLNFAPTPEAQSQQGQGGTGSGPAGGSGGPQAEDSDSGGGGSGPSSP